VNGRCREGHGYVDGNATVILALDEEVISMSAGRVALYRVTSISLTLRALQYLQRQAALEIRH